MGSRYSSANKVFSYNKTSNKPVKKSTCQPSLHISQGTGKGGGEKGGRGEGGRREEKGRRGEERRGGEERGEEATGRSPESLQHKALTNLCSASNLVPNYASRYL